MKYCIEHIGIMSRNPLELAQWYQDVLGFNQLFIPPEENTPVFVRDQGGYILEFFSMPEGFKHSEDQVRKAQHLCLTIDDYDKAVKDLESKGVLFKEDGFTIFQEGKVRFFQDPEGNWIHLVYRKKIPWS
ncbi:VOC family protein [Oceanispirochaeta crateris]|uniref:VOC family protein n=1 Tax=Oceanispirochaeta crateris TaxID=2518645 RepID=A0A5C1QK54_9SPIO|nr:VOC family protein [Oceanispirochaeta crateris]QEN08505.1 VOC family protein [Oceanispirochaeta crateris]